jgi:co-chaperonin GroES (HSP10)
MAVKGKITPLRDKVMVSDMDFGEQKLSSGIILRSDDGKDHGIHPRWGKVYAVGPEHKEDYNIGDWVLVEHGRWSRGIEVEESSGEKKTIRLIDTNCVMLWDDKEPNDVILGKL